MKETGFFFFSVCVIEQKKTSNVYLFWDLFIEIFNGVERDSMWCIKLQKILPQNKYIYSSAHGTLGTQKYLVGKRRTEVNIKDSFP